MATEEEPTDNIHATVVAVGNLAVGFSSLEVLMHVLVWTVLEPAQLGMAPRVTENMQAAALADLLARLAPFSAQPDRLKSLVADFKRVSGIRNDALHAVPFEGALRSRKEWLKSVVRDVVGDVPRSSVSPEAAHAALLDCYEIQERAKALIAELSPP